MNVRNRDDLTAAEVRTLFQKSLENELARAVEEFQFGTGSDHEKTIANRVLAWAAVRKRADAALPRAGALARPRRRTSWLHQCPMQPV